MCFALPKSSVTKQIITIKAEQKIESENLFSHEVLKKSLFYFIFKSGSRTLKAVLNTDLDTNDLKKHSN